MRKGMRRPHQALATSLPSNSSFDGNLNERLRSVTNHVNEYTPPAVSRLCSGTSQVLRDCPTPHQRACWTSGSRPSPTGPLTTSCRALMGSPGSRAWSFHACQGSRTAQSPAGTRATVSADIAFRMWELRRHSDFRDFRGSMACLHVPLSTLHVQPCDCPRMTRGQDGSLGLACVTFTFTTPRRFTPAHSPSPPLTFRNPSDFAGPRRPRLLRILRVGHLSSR